MNAKKNGTPFRQPVGIAVLKWNRAVHLTIFNCSCFYPLWESHRAAIKLFHAVWMSFLRNGSYALRQTSPAPWSAWNWKDIVCSNAGETVRTGRAQSVENMFCRTCPPVHEQLVGDSALLGLDYAIMSGGDVGPLGKDAVGWAGCEVVDFCSHPQCICQ